MNESIITILEDKLTCNNNDKKGYTIASSEILIGEICGNSLSPLFLLTQS